MTPEERQELRDWSARLMGWEFFDTECLKLYSDPTTGRGVMYYKDWAPDLPTSPASQILGVVDKLRSMHYEVEILFCDHWKTGEPIAEITISYSEKHPLYPKSSCRESGDEVVAVVETDNPLDATLLAARKAVEGR